MLRLQSNVNTGTYQDFVFKGVFSTQLFVSFVWIRDTLKTFSVGQT